MQWLPGYLYRRPFIILPTIDGPQTNYQLMVNINKGAGVPAGNTTYLNNHSFLWPKDVFFTLRDGLTPLSLWRETYDAVMMSLWTKFNAIPAQPDNGLFYMYYGNADAADASNGTNTFIFFEGWDSWNSDKWPAQPSSVTLSGGIATIGPCPPVVNITSKIALTYPFRIMSNAQTDGDYYGCPFHSMIAGYSRGFINQASTTMYAYQNGSGGLWTVQISLGDLNGAYHLWELRDFARNSAKYYVDSTYKGQSTLNTYQTGANYINIEQNDTGASTKSKEIFVTNITANEPTWGAWGPEERVPNRYISFGQRRREIFYRSLKMK